MQKQKKGENPHKHKYGLTSNSCYLRCGKGWNWVWFGAALVSTVSQDVQGPMDPDPACLINGWTIILGSNPSRDYLMRTGFGEQSIWKAYKQQQGSLNPTCTCRKQWCHTLLLFYNINLPEWIGPAPTRANQSMWSADVWVASHTWDQKNAQFAPSSLVIFGFLDIQDWCAISKYRDMI